MSPLEEGVTLAVALEFKRGIEGVRIAGAVFVDLHGVVDDELGGLEGIDLLRIATEDFHGVAHRGEVDDGGDTGEVLHEDAGGHPGDFAGGLGFRVPLREELDVVGSDAFAVLVAEEVFEKDAEAEGEAREADVALLLESAEAEDLVGLAAGFEFGLAAEGASLSPGVEEAERDEERPIRLKCVVLYRDGLAGSGGAAGETRSLNRRSSFSILEPFCG